MKKLFFYVSAISALFVSCSKERECVNSDETVSIEVTCDNPKTSLSEDLSVSFVGGDHIAVVGEGRHDFATEDGGKSAIFTGVLAGDESTTFYVINPFSSCISRKNGTGEFNVLIPSVQNAVRGNVDPAALVSVGMTANLAGGVFLRNVCSIIRVELTRSDVESVSIVGSSDDKLSGTMTVNICDSIPVFGSSDSKVVTLKGESGSLAPGAYFICVRPGTLSAGSMIKFTRNSGSESAYQNFAREISISRSGLVNLGVVDGSLSWAEEKSESPIPDYTKLAVLSHPRLFMTASDFDGLRSHISSADSDDFTLKMHNFVIKRAVALAKYASSKLSGTMSYNESKQALARLFHFAYAYKMGDTQYDYLALAKADLATVCGYSNWIPSHFLTTSEMALGVAVAYDWMYEGLSSEERTMVQNALTSKFMTPFSTFNLTPVNKTNNWNPVCNGTAAAVGIAMYSENETTSEAVIDKAVESNVLCANTIYSPDGAGIEGMNYWEYAMMFQQVMITALETALGSSCSLSDAEGFDKTGYFRLYADGPAGYWNYSDHTTASDQTSSPEMIWLAAHYSRPDYLAREKKYLAETRYSVSRTLPLCVCELYKHPVSPAGAAFPTSKVWWSRGASPEIIVRDGWTYGESDKFFGIKGGGGLCSHSHMDAGSFVYDAQGIRWSSDYYMGKYDEYEAAVSGFWSYAQNSNRWDILGMNSYYHSTLAFTYSDGSVSKRHTTDQVVGSTGSVERILNNDFDGYGGTVDLSVYYSDAASSVKRTAVLKGGDLHIEDEIKSLSSHDSPFEWRMVTLAEIVLFGNYVVLTKSGKTMYLYVQTEGEVASAPVFSVETVERPSTWPAKSWDSIQSYSSCKILKYKASVPSGSKTTVFRTILSPTNPGLAPAEGGTGNDPFNPLTGPEDPFENM